MVLMLSPLVLQAALRQQMAMQQRQEAMRLLSTLTPEQREQLGRLPSIQQVRSAIALHSILIRYPNLPEVGRGVAATIVGSMTVAHVKMA